MKKSKFRKDAKTELSREQESPRTLKPEDFPFTGKPLPKGIERATPIDEHGRRLKK